MKKLIALALLMSFGAVAAPNMSINNPSGSDRIRTADGATCEQAVATGKTFIAGVYGSDDQYDDNWHGSGSRGYTSNDKGVYAGVQIQLGSADRIDCNRMYNNEMARKDIQLEQLRQKHEMEMEVMRAELERVRGGKSLHFSE